MEAVANLSIAQIRALLKDKEAQVAQRDSAEFKQKLEELTTFANELIEDTTAIAYEDLVRAMAEECGIALKTKKGKRKRVSTEVTRKSGTRKVNAYMLLLNEERRKLKLTGRKEPKEMTTNANGNPTKKFLVDVSKGIWTYLKSTGLTNNSAVFQVDYQTWNKETPTENCTPYFVKWWNECEDKEAYNVSTDWETYYKGVDACVVDEADEETDALIANPAQKKRGSGCRFNLRRKLDGRNQPLYFIMLNPSNADATDCEKNDPTIKECIKHANARSAREIQVVNLFPVVTSRPEKLDHILIEQNLEENNKELSRTFYEAEKNKQSIICAWGNPTKIKKNDEIYSLFKKQVDHIKNLAKKHKINLKCIGTTKEGNPKHPLGPKRCGNIINYGYIEQFTTY